MSFLGETCAISELIKPRPLPPVAVRFCSRRATNGLSWREVGGGVT